MNNLSAHAGQPSDCCDLCADLGFGCKAYVWNDYAGGTCWFKTATGPPAVQFGYIAGTVGSCDNLNKKEKQKSKTEL
uniref:Apple domain-containing protein n=1 Tax=Panagrolaimus superbus TaxID=310955 RepID=A0A914Y252_9BILA